MLLNWKVNTNEALASKQSGLAILYDLKRTFIPAEPIMSWQNFVSEILEQNSLPLLTTFWNTQYVWVDNEFFNLHNQDDMIP